MRTKGRQVHTRRHQKRLESLPLYLSVKERPLQTMNVAQMHIFYERSIQENCLFHTQLNLNAAIYVEKNCISIGLNLDYT